MSLIYNLQDIYCLHIIFSVYDILWKLISPYIKTGLIWISFFSGNSNALDIAESGFCQNTKWSTQPHTFYSTCTGYVGKKIKKAFDIGLKSINLAWFRLSKCLMFPNVWAYILLTFSVEYLQWRTLYQPVQFYDLTGIT